MSIQQRFNDTSEGMISLKQHVMLRKHYIFKLSVRVHSDSTCASVERQDLSNITKHKERKLEEMKITEEAGLGAGHQEPDEI